MSLRVSKSPASAILSSTSAASDAKPPIGPTGVEEAEFANEMNYQQKGAPAVREDDCDDIEEDSEIAAERITPVAQPVVAQPTQTATVIVNKVESVALELLIENLTAAKPTIESESQIFQDTNADMASQKDTPNLEELNLDDDGKMEMAKVVDLVLDEKGIDVAREIAVKKESDVNQEVVKEDMLPKELQVQIKNKDEILIKENFIVKDTKTTNDDDLSNDDGNSFIENNVRSYVASDDAALKAAQEVARPKRVSVDMQPLVDRVSQIDIAKLDVVPDKAVQTKAPVVFDPKQADDLAWKWLNDVGREVRVSIGKDDHVATIRLRPPELGEMQVNIKTSDGQVHLQMTVDSDAAKKTVERHLHELDKMMRQDYLSLGSTQVDVGQKSFNRDNWEEMQEGVLGWEIPKISQQEVQVVPKVVADGRVDIRI